MKTGIGTSGFGLRCSFADPAVHTADERPCCPIGSSGKRRQNPGRRYVGGHLYDSVLGVTCHVCRQKAIEDHVLCSKCARAFCRRCMRTRHGEDLDIEVKYDHWVCPKCRGGCGPGCVDCCNCSKCRQQHGLAPTKISAALLQASGFDNVHDYLIHLRTKESAAAILARKLGKKWCRSHLERPGAAESLRLLVACSCKKASISNNPVSSPPRATKEEVPGIRQPDEARNPWNPKATATNGVAGSSKARQSPLNPNSGIPKDHTHSNVGGVRGASSKAPVSPNSSIPSDYTHPNVRMSEPWTVDYSSPAKFMSRVQETTDHRDDYKRGLEMLLAAPYDPIELRNKWKSIRCRKPICRSVETRARSYDMESTTLGRSYMDHYPDFAFKFTEAISKEEKLELLRGFFYWLEHASTPGAFKPWTEKQENEDDECAEIDNPNYETCHEVYDVEEDYGMYSLVPVGSKELVKLDLEQVYSSQLPLKRVKQEYAD